MKITRLVFILLCCLTQIVGVAKAAPQRMSPIDPPLQAPAFSLPDLNEQLRSLEEFKGKPVIVNFWATWCPPCRAEMPSMERAWQKIESEGIVMVGINVGEDFDTVFGFTAEIDVNFPLLLDKDSSATKKWPIRGLPTTYVINPDGEIVYQALGGREWDDEALLNQVRELIQ